MQLDASTQSTLLLAILTFEWNDWALRHRPGQLENKPRFLNRLVTAQAERMQEEETSQAVQETEGATSSQDALGSEAAVGVEKLFEDERSGLSPPGNSSRASTSHLHTTSGDFQ